MTVVLKGGRELAQFLEQFPENLQRKVLRNGLRRGATGS